jgi:hypothetical protein
VPLSLIIRFNLDSKFIALQLQLAPVAVAFPQFRRVRLIMVIRSVPLFRYLAAVLLTPYLDISNFNRIPRSGEENDWTALWNRSWSQHRRCQRFVTPLTSRWPQCFSHCHGLSPCFHALMLDFLCLMALMSSHSSLLSIPCSITHTSVAFYTILVCFCGKSIAI